MHPSGRRVLPFALIAAPAWSRLPGLRGSCATPRRISSKVRHCGDPRNDNDDPVGGAILLHHDSPPGELVGEVAYLIFSRVSRVLLESEVEKDEKKCLGGLFLVGYTE